MQKGYCLDETPVADYLDQVLPLFEPWLLFVNSDKSVAAEGVASGVLCSTEKSMNYDKWYQEDQ